MEKTNFGIYVHIPFCKSKCEYCSFVSKCASEEEIQKYIIFLCDEILLKASYYKNKKVSSIYFGGGTPSFISAKHIQRVLNAIYLNFQVNKNAEISIECNPCSTTKEKLETYKNSGINRISFGVQSLNDNLLKTLGRKHTSNMAENAIKTAKEIGFTNISVDLMIGVPNQNTNDLAMASEKLANLGVNHISAYMLMLEEGTPLYKKVNSKELFVADDDECVEMYNLLVKKLKSCGFNRYEISNFSKKGCECKHNINYWDMGEYLGFGVASHSYVDGIRFANFDDFENYYKVVENLKNKEKNIKNTEKTLNNEKKLAKNHKNSDINLFNDKEIDAYNVKKQAENYHLKDVYKTYEILEKKEIIEETIMLGLRQKRGVSLQSLLDLGYDILKEKAQILDKLKEQKIIKITKTYIKLNPKHFGVCSAVVLELI